MPQLAFSDWTAEQLRCTAFILPGNGSLSAAHWWTKLAGGDPEQVSSNPRIGASQAHGKFEPGALIVSTQPGRVDWFLSPTMAAEVPILGQADAKLTAPTLAGAVEAFKIFSELSRKWLSFDDIPPVNRLALGGVLVHPEEDKQAAYSRLQDYVPVKVDLQSSDFLYQINLPTQTRLGIQGLMINRLSKWSVSLFRLIAVMNDVRNPAALVGGDTAVALRSEIDINTAQEFLEVLPKERLVEIFDELIENGRNVITTGVHYSDTAPRR